MQNKPTLSFFLFFCLSIALCSCSRYKSYHQSENSTDFDRKVELQEVEEISLPLDSVTGFFSNSVSYYQSGGRKNLSILSYENNCINVYNLESKTLSKKIIYDKQGPNGIGQLDGASSHFILSEDSIFVYNNRQCILYLTKSNGEVIRKVRLIDPKNDFEAAVPNFNTRHPAVKIGNSLYLPCEINLRRQKYSDYNTIMRMNLSTFKIDYVKTMPTIYDQAYWGTYFKYHNCLTYNSTTNKIYVSYPIDPILYVATLEGKLLDERYVGSEKFKSIEPMIDSDEFNEKDVEFAKQDEYSLTNPDYAGIFYNKYLNIYYRFVYIRPSVEDYKTVEYRIRTSVLILDEHLNKIGETLLSKEYDASIFFIDENGLNIAKYGKYLENQDLLTFGLLKTVNLKSNESN